MSNLKKQQEKQYQTIKLIAQVFSSHSSQQDNYVCPCQPKSQQKDQDIIPSADPISIKYQRQSRKKQTIVKINNKANKRKNKVGIQDDNIVKQEERKIIAAPKQQVTSDSNYEKSQKSEKSEEQKAAPNQPKQSSRLYIGHLPLQFTQQQIRKLFKKFGSIKEAKLIINSTTGKSKGFGFVQYLDVTAAKKAKLQLSTHILNGQKITIQFCELQ